VAGIILSLSLCTTTAQQQQNIKIESDIMTRSYIKSNGLIRWYTCGDCSVGTYLNNSINELDNLRPLRVPTAAGPGVHASHTTALREQRRMLLHGHIQIILFAENQHAPRQYGLLAKHIPYRILREYICISIYGSICAHVV
jgi:hypothetical protein